MDPPLLVGVIATQKPFLSHCSPAAHRLVDGHVHGTVPLDVHSVSGCALATVGYDKRKENRVSSRLVCYLVLSLEADSTRIAQ